MFSIVNMASIADTLPTSTKTQLEYTVSEVNDVIASCVLKKISASGFYVFTVCLEFLNSDKTATTAGACALSVQFERPIKLLHNLEAHLSHSFSFKSGNPSNLLLFTHFTDLIVHYENLYTEHTRMLEFKNGIQSL